MYSWVKTLKTLMFYWPLLIVYDSAVVELGPLEEQAACRRCHGNAHLAHLPRARQLPDYVAARSLVGVGCKRPPSCGQLYSCGIAVVS